MLVAKNKFQFLVTFIFSSADAFTLDGFNRSLLIYSFEHIEEKSFRKTLWKKVKLLKLSNFTFFTMFSMQLSKNLLMATFNMSSAAFLNLGRSQNGVLGSALKFCHLVKRYESYKNASKLDK